MTLLLHGSVCADQYLVDVGELVPVSAINARSAWTMAQCQRVMELRSNRVHQNLPGSTSSIPRAN
jgi:hypothetical protein